MNKRPAIIFLLVVVILAAGAWIVLTSYWRQGRPAFENTPKLIAAVQAYSRDCTAKKQPLPPKVSLSELVDGGYISKDDVKAFDGMEVTISLGHDEINSKQVLMRVRLFDGTETALMVDGTVQAVPKLE